VSDTTARLELVLLELDEMLRERFLDSRREEPLARVAQALELLRLYLRELGEARR